jgi:hypothetical protein
MRDRRAAILLVGCTVAGGLWAVASGPAHAATPSTVLVANTMAIPSGGHANDTIDCPAGTVAIGGGGSQPNGTSLTSSSPLIGGAFLDTVADGTYPDTAPTGWNVSASAPASEAELSVTAYAICATATGALPSAYTMVVGSSTPSAEETAHS